MEELLLTIREELIEELSNLKNPLQKQKDFLEFLVNVNKEYFSQGLCPTSQKQFDFTASQADITVFGG